jgi:hypothetical protein
MNKDFWDKSAELLILLSYLVGGIFAISVFGWQIFHWLRMSEWVAMPVSEIFNYFGIFLTYVYFPSDWYGLARIAQWMLDIPMAVAVPVILVLVAHLWQEIISESRNQTNKINKIEN